MKLVSPRMIVGNRGDLLSRFGILEAFERLANGRWTLFAEKPADAGPIEAEVLPYGPLYNFWPRWRGWKAIAKSDAVVWTGGLDLQDDSSLLKLLHTWLTFRTYRLLGKRIYMIAQGAGPLKSRLGRFLARRIVRLADVFLTRDSGTQNLLESLDANAPLLRGHDGIFLGGLDRLAPAADEVGIIHRLTHRASQQPLVGFNLRLWFHFTGGLLPYQLAKKKFQERSRQPMDRLIEAAVKAVGSLRDSHRARVVLLSMYEPGTHPWEDDLPHLARIKEAFSGDPDVVLVEDPLSMGGFCEVMRRLDLMIGTRLHSTLTALRFGVPAINLSYTDKCRDIFADLGMADSAIDLEAFMNDPSLLVCRAGGLLADSGLRPRLRTLVRQRIDENERLLAQIFDVPSRQSKRSAA